MLMNAVRIQISVPLRQRVPTQWEVTPVRVWTATREQATYAQVQLLMIN